MRWQFCVILVLMLTACSNKESDTVIPKDKMSKVLWDMIQVDEMAALQLAKDSTKNPKKERIEMYQKVFRIHQVSKEQFSKSFTYYSGHPDMMKTMFDSLEARGARERKRSYVTKDSVAK